MFYDKRVTPYCGDLRYGEEKDGSMSTSTLFFTAIESTLRIKTLHNLFDVL